MRTGATSGVATRYLAGEDSDSVGIIGAGVQARTQLWAVCEARQIEKAEVYDIDIGKARDFAIEMAEKLGIEVSVEESPQRVAKNSDILIIATTSRVPVIEGRWLEGKVHINSVGWVGPDGRELDSSTVEMARLFVDSKEAVLEESGDIIIPIKEGVVTEGKIDGEIGELVSGIKEGRRAEDGITLFKSVGLAIEDAAVAELAYEKALKEGIGLEVEL
jgi:ornithine cyclodeaminase/alanine dehydrogenase